MNCIFLWAAMIATLFFAGATVSQAAPAPIRLEAEAAQRTGNPRVLSARAGFSGTGYVSGFTADGDKISWTAQIPASGIYQIRVRYSAPGGPKGYDVTIGDVKISAMLPATGEVFATAIAGRLELRAGATTVTLEKGWGYYDIDALDIVPAPVETNLARPPATLSDARATVSARELMRFLVGTYGARTLSGQYEAPDNDYISRVTGQTPAIFGGDFMDYSPSRVEHGTQPDGISEKYLQRARDGQILTLMWHWNAPSHLIDKNYTDKDGKTVEALWYSGFYTRATTFDLAAALADPNSTDYKLLLRDMDVIAAQLQKFADAKIPVLWRPLHEAEGTWFWWGAKGPEPFKKLWRLMYDRFTRERGLHNLIWVYTAGANPKWYPGDDVVDIVGADAYPSDSGDPLTGVWDDLTARYGGRKLIALSEFGKVPDIARMRNLGVKWSYFASWSGDLGPKPLDADRLKSLYNAPGVLNQRGVQAMQIATLPASNGPMSPNSDALPPLSGAMSSNTADLPPNKEALPTIKAAPLKVEASFPVANPALLGTRTVKVGPTRADYARLASEAQTNLQRQVLAQWFPRALDDKIGGFSQNFAENWAPLPGQERSIVYQSRLTWTAATAALRFPAQAATYRPIAAHGADFLRDKMWDAQAGGFFWEIENGVATRGGEKHVYGNAFAIYALSAAFRATGDARDLELAQAAFRWLDTHAHDARSGGYFEALTREGAPILKAPTPDQTSDWIGTRYGFKSMNSHIHLLEALGALYQIWPDAALKTRVYELFVLVRDRIYVEPGALNTFFTPDWRAVPDHDSYGHDIETAYLLSEAAQILGLETDFKTRQTARALVDHTLEVAFDAENGGIYDAGSAFGNVTVTDKVWWTQAEGLNALLLMHRLYGAQTLRYWDAFLKQWNWIQTHQLDSRFGGWYSVVSRTGEAPPGHIKSDRWTESYHQGRALFNVSEALNTLAASAK